MIDLTKPVQTRDGREVEIYNKERLHGAIRLLNGDWFSCVWQKDGRSEFIYNRSCDLVNAPPKMITLRMYVSMWADVGWRADPKALSKDQLDDEDLITFNFPIDIKIPEGYGV